MASIYQDRELALISTLTGFDVLPGSKLCYGSVIALESLETSRFLEVIADTLSPSAALLSSSSTAAAVNKGVNDGTRKLLQGTAKTKQAAAASSGASASPSCPLEQAGLQMWLSSDAPNPILASVVGGPASNIKRPSSSSRKGSKTRERADKPTPSARAAARLLKTCLFRIVNADDPRSEAEVKNGDNIALEVLMRQQPQQQQQSSRHHASTHYAVAARVLLEHQQDPRYAKARLDRALNPGRHAASDSMLNSPTRMGHDPLYHAAAVSTPVPADGIAMPSQALSKWRATAAPLTAFNGFPGDVTALGLVATALARSNIPPSLRMYKPITKGALMTKAFAGKGVLQGASSGAGESGGSTSSSLATSASLPLVTYQAASAMMTRFTVTVHSAAEVMEALRWGRDEGEKGEEDAAQLRLANDGASGGSQRRSRASSSSRGVHWGGGGSSEGKPATPKSPAAAALDGGKQQAQGRPRSASALSPVPGQDSASGQQRPRSGSARTSGALSSNGLISSGDALQLKAALNRMLNRAHQRLAALVPGTNFMPLEALADPLAYRFKGGKARGKGAPLGSPGKRTAAALSSDDDEDEHASGQGRRSGSAKRPASGLLSSGRPGTAGTGRSRQSRQSQTMKGDAPAPVDLGHLAVISLSMDLGHLQAIRVVVPGDVVTSQSAAASANDPLSARRWQAGSAPSSPSASPPSSPMGTLRSAADPAPVSARSSFATTANTPSGQLAASQGNSRGNSRANSRRGSVTSATRRRGSVASSTNRQRQQGSDNEDAEVGGTARSNAEGSKAEDAEGPAAAIPPSQAPIYEVIVAPALEAPHQDPSALLAGEALNKSSSATSLPFPSDAVMLGMGSVRQRMVNWSGSEDFSKRHSRRFIDLDLNSEAAKNGSSEKKEKGDGNQAVSPLNGHYDDADDEDEDEDENEELDDEARMRIVRWKREKRRQALLAAEAKEERTKEGLWRDFLRGHRDLRGRPTSAPPLSRVGTQPLMLVGPASPSSTGPSSPSSLLSPTQVQSGQMFSFAAAGSRHHARSASASAVAAAPSASSFIDDLGIPKEVIRGTGRRGHQYSKASAAAAATAANDGSSSSSSSSSTSQQQRQHPLFQKPVIRASGMWRLWIVAPSLGVLNSTLGAGAAATASGAVVAGGSDNDSGDEASSDEDAVVAGASGRLSSARSRPSVSAAAPVMSARGIEMSRLVSDRARAMAAAAALGRPTSAASLSGRISAARQQKKSYDSGGAGAASAAKRNKWTIDNLRKEKAHLNTQRPKQQQPPSLGQSASMPALSHSATTTAAAPAHPSLSIWPRKQPLEKLGQHPHLALATPSVVAARAAAARRSSPEVAVRAVPPLPTALLAQAAAAKADSPVAADSPSKKANTISSPAPKASSVSFAVVQDRARRQLLMQASAHHEEVYSSLRELASPKARGGGRGGAAGGPTGVRSTPPLPIPIPGRLSHSASAADCDITAGLDANATQFPKRITPMAAALVRKSLLTPIHAMVAARKTPKAASASTVARPKIAFDLTTSSPVDNYNNNNSNTSAGASPGAGKTNVNLQSTSPEQLPMSSGLRYAFHAPSASAAALLAEALDAFSPVPSSGLAYLGSPAAAGGSGGKGTDPRAVVGSAGRPSPNALHRASVVDSGDTRNSLTFDEEGEQGGEGEDEEGDEEEVVRLEALPSGGARLWKQSHKLKSLAAANKAFPYKAGPMTPRRMRLSPVAIAPLVSDDTADLSDEVAPDAAAASSQQQALASGAPEGQAYSESLQHLARLIVSSQRIRSRLAREEAAKEKRRRQDEERKRGVALLTLTGRRESLLAAKGSVVEDGYSHSHSQSQSQSQSHSSSLVTTTVKADAGGDPHVFSFLPSHRESASEAGADEFELEPEPSDEGGSGDDAFAVVAARVLTADKPLKEKLPYCERKAERTLRNLRVLLVWWKKRRLLLLSQRWDLTLKGHRAVLATVVRRKAAITGGFDDERDRADEEKKTRSVSERTPLFTPQSSTVAASADEERDKEGAGNSDAVPPSTPVAGHTGGAKGLIGAMVASAKVNRRAAEELISQADAGKMKFARLVNSTRGKGPSVSSSASAPNLVLSPNASAGDGNAGTTTHFVDRGPAMTVEVLGATPAMTRHRRRISSGGILMLSHLEDVAAAAMVMPRVRGPVTPRIQPYSQTVAQALRTPVAGNSSSSAALTSPAATSAAGGGGGSATASSPKASASSSIAFWSLPGASPAMQAAAMVVGNCDGEDDPHRLRERFRLSRAIEDGIRRSSSDASLRPRRPLSGLHLAVNIDRYNNSTNNSYNNSYSKAYKAEGSREHATEAAVVAASGSPSTDAATSQSSHSLGAAVSSIQQARQEQPFTGSAFVNAATSLKREFDPTASNANASRVGKLKLSRKTQGKGMQRPQRARSAQGQAIAPWATDGRSEQDSGEAQGDDQDPTGAGAGAGEGDAYESPGDRYRRHARAATAQSLPPLIDDSAILRAYKPDLFSVTVPSTPAAATATTTPKSVGAGLGGGVKKGSLLEFIFLDEERKRKDYVGVV